MRSMTRMSRAAEQVHSDLVAAEVVDRSVPIFKHDHGMDGIDNRLTGELATNALAVPLKRHGVAGPVFEFACR